MRGKKRKILFALEIIILLLFIGGLYVYGQIMTRLDKIEQPVLKEEEILINQEAPQMTGYSTYALFGIDHRDKNPELGSENSDTIIIASVNNDTKDVKLVSVYRDTLLNIGDDTYTKANAAYAYGGPEQAISMLNTSLDLNITDYATIDFNALVTVIDLLGGLDIPLSYAEIEHMNNYCVETSEETGKSYTPIEKPDPAPEDQEAIYGTYHLNGVQATSYCRIRYTSSLDMGRTERQRMVIQLIVQKAKQAGLGTIFDIMDEVFPMASTSLSKQEILELIPAMIGYSVDDTTGFPMKYKFAEVNGSDIIVPTNLVSNVKRLHRFLYGKDTDYKPSTEVRTYSKRIIEIVGGEDELQEEATVTSEEQETNDTFIWQDTPTGENAWTGGTTTGGDTGWSDGSGTGTGGGTWTDPGTGGGTTTDPGTGGGTWTDPGTGGGTTTDPGTGGGTTTDPGTGGGTTTDPGTGGGTTTDPGTGGGTTTDPGTGGGTTTDPGTGGGTVTDPGTGGGTVTDPGTGGTAGTETVWNDGI